MPEDVLIIGGGDVRSGTLLTGEVTEFEGDDAGPVPTLLVAVTVKV